MFRNQVRPRNLTWLIYVTARVLYKALCAEQSDRINALTRKYSSRAVLNLDHELPLVIVANKPLTIPYLQYDTDVVTWSPQGRLHQVEYAMEAVKQGSVAVGLKVRSEN